MQVAMIQRVVSDGYGLKGKSKWATEAIRQFLQDRSWKDQTLDLQMIVGNDAKDVIYMDLADRKILDRAAIDVYEYAVEMKEKGYRSEVIETLDVSVSAVIRAAIASRLFDLRMPKIEQNPELDFGATPRNEKNV